MIDNSKIIADIGALEQLTEEERRMLKSRGNRLGGRICKILRHSPEMIQIPMDRQGWVSVSEFIEKFNEKFRGPMFYLTLPVLMEIVRTDGKQRYGLRREGDKLMIRCNQGHSIPWLEMDYKEGTPPEVLYHGTGFCALDSILKEGLKPMTRQKVHLSWDTATARQVAGRWKNQGAPAILKIDAEGMARDGYVFYLSENEIWLTDSVPPEYLSVFCVEG